MKLATFKTSPDSFVYLDQDTRLVIWVGGERLGLFGRNGGVPFDQHSHDTTGCLNAQRERSYIQQQQVLHILRFIAG